MDVDEQKAPCRRELLAKSVETTIRTAFATLSEPETRSRLDIENIAPEEQASLDGTFNKIREVVENTVHAHVNVWLRESGVDQILEVFDRHDARQVAKEVGEEVKEEVVGPETGLAGMSLGRARVEYKEKLLEELRREMEEKKKEVERISGEVEKESQKLEGLSERVANVGKELNEVY